MNEVFNNNIFEYYLILKTEGNLCKYMDGHLRHFA